MNTTCNRCGKEFPPKFCAPLKRFYNHCDQCRLRNLFDCLDLPTPPEMLDKFSRNPTLSERQYHKSLSSMKEEE